MRVGDEHARYARGLRHTRCSPEPAIADDSFAAFHPGSSANHVRNAGSFRSSDEKRTARCLFVVIHPHQDCCEGSSHNTCTEYRSAGATEDLSPAHGHSRPSWTTTIRAIPMREVHHRSCSILATARIGPRRRGRCRGHRGRARAALAAYARDFRVLHPSASSLAVGGDGSHKVYVSVVWRRASSRADLGRTDPRTWPAQLARRADRARPRASSIGSVRTSTHCAVGRCPGVTSGRPQLTPKPDSGARSGVPRST